MGWYRFVPFMECFHGVVSLNHELEGDFLIENQVFSFDGGKGYIEKDWGGRVCLRHEFGPKAIPLRIDRTIRLCYWWQTYLGLGSR